MKIFFFCFFCASFAFAKTEIVTSFSILHDVVKNIVGSDVSIENLVPYDQDPHSYQMLAKNYVLLRNASVVIAIGSDFEGWLPSSLERMSSRAKTYYVTKDLALIPLAPESPGLHNHQHPYGKWDPHFWQSPQKMIMAVENISRFLQGQYPSHKQAFQNRTENYVKEIKLLQERYQTEFSKIPESSRQLVVAHNSLQYFAQEFHIRTDSPLDVDEEGESSIQKISSLIQKIKTQKIKSLFLEKGAPIGLMENISKETHVPLSGTLYSDCLSTAPDASTYLKLLEYNLNLILKSMKGLP